MLRSMFIGSHSRVGFVLALACDACSNPGPAAAGDDASGRPSAGTTAAGGLSSDAAPSNTDASGGTTGGGTTAGGTNGGPGGSSTLSGGTGTSDGTAGTGAVSGGDAGSLGEGDACSVKPPSRHQASYPEIDPALAGCGSWALVDNVCCARYCADDPRSESCDRCEGTDQCVPVSSKACISGEWPEVHCIGEDEPWHYSRSTHYGLTNGGACGFGYYGVCTTADKFKYSDPTLAAQCDAFCKAYPALCQDPDDITLRGNFAAPQGNYYTQFWPSLPGDRDNYLSCGECFEVERTKPDGSEYQPGEDGYAAPVVLQVTDSCPCSANSKWCCGSGRDHCAEVHSDTLDFTYGCPLPPGDLPADHDPEPNESIHLDLGDIAMARLQSGDPNLGMVDGVIPTKYKRVPCPVIGNIYIWLLPGASNYYFALSAVNASGPGSITKIEAKLASGEWVLLKRDGNYTSARPQERYGTWVVPQGAGPFELPISLRFSSPTGEVIEATGAIKAFAPSDPEQDRQMYYIDSGAQFASLR